MTTNQYPNTQDLLGMFATAMKVIPLIAKGQRKKTRGRASRSAERVRLLLDASSGKEGSDLRKAVSGMLSELFERSEDQCAMDHVLKVLREENARLNEQNAALKSQLHESRGQTDAANARVDWTRANVQAHVRRVSKRSGLTGHEQEIAKSLFGSILFDEGGKDLPPGWDDKRAWQGMYEKAEKLRTRCEEAATDARGPLGTQTGANDAEGERDLERLRTEHASLRDACQNLIFSATGRYWTEDNPDIEKLVAELGELDRFVVRGQLDALRVTDALSITSGAAVGTIDMDVIVQRIEELKLPNHAELSSLRKQVEDLEFKLEQMSAMREGIILYNRLSKALCPDDDVPPIDDDYEDEMIAAVQRMVSGAEDSDRFEAQLEDEHRRLAMALGLISDEEALGFTVTDEEGNLPAKITFDEMLAEVDVIKTESKEAHKRADVMAELAEQVATAFGYDQVRGNVDSLRSDLVRVPFWLAQVRAPRTV